MPAAHETCTREDRAPQLATREGVDSHGARRSNSVQFTLRIERRTNQALQEIAARRGVTTSEAAREAIRAYTQADGLPPRLDALVDRIVEGVVSRLSSADDEGRPRH
jgi:predicted transcriptional regulator